MCEVLVATMHQGRHNLQLTLARTSRKGRETWNYSCETASRVPRLRRGDGSHFWSGLSLVMVRDDGVVRKLTFKDPDC